jgi:hypothetical protein
VKQVGRELGVRYVLEGSVRKGGNRVRISAQLIEAETGTHLWADRFDGLLEDVFELQDQVAVRVASAIEPKLRFAEIQRAYQHAGLKLLSSRADLLPERHLKALARLQDKVADEDASINETRRKIEIAREAVRRARVQDNIPEKYKKHYMPSRMALREADALHKQQAELGSKVQALRARAFNAAATQAETEAWRQLEAAVSLRDVLLTQEINKINDAGAELVPITKPESRLDAKYDEFWAPIEELADQEPEEDVPVPASMALEEPKKRKRDRRR